MTTNYVVIIHAMISLSTAFLKYFFRLFRGQTGLGDVQLLKHVQHVRMSATTNSIKRFALVTGHLGEEQTHAAKVRDAGEDQTRSNETRQPDEIEIHKTREQHAG